MTKRLTAVLLTLAMLMTMFTPLKSQAATYEIIIPKGHEKAVGYVGGYLQVDFLLRKNGKMVSPDEFPPKMKLADKSIVKWDGYALECKKTGTTTVTITKGNAKATVEVEVLSGGLTYPKVMYLSEVEKDNTPYQLNGYGKNYSGNSFNLESKDTKILKVEKVDYEEGSLYNLFPKKEGMVTLVVTSGKGQEELTLEVRKEPQVTLTGYKAKVKKNKVVGVTLTIQNNNGCDLELIKMLIGEEMGLSEFYFNELITVKAGETKDIYVSGRMSYAFTRKGKLIKYFELGVGGYFGGEPGYTYFGKNGKPTIYVGL